MYDGTWCFTHRGIYELWSKRLLERTPRLEWQNRCSCICPDRGQISTACPIRKVQYFGFRGIHCPAQVSLCVLLGIGAVVPFLSGLSTCERGNEGVLLAPGSDFGVCKLSVILRTRFISEKPSSLRRRGGWQTCCNRVHGLKPGIWIHVSVGKEIRLATSAWRSTSISGALIPTTRAYLAC